PSSSGTGAGSCGTLTFGASTTGSGRGVGGVSIDWQPIENATGAMPLTARTILPSRSVSSPAIPRGASASVVWWPSSGSASLDPGLAPVIIRPDPADPGRTSLAPILPIQRPRAPKTRGRLISYTPPRVHF